jgi:type IV secretion system pilin
MHRLILTFDILLNMLKRKIWLVLIIVMGLFLFVKVNVVKAEDKGNCYCTLEKGERIIEEDNCTEGYGPKPEIISRPPDIDRCFCSCKEGYVFEGINKGFTTNPFKGCSNETSINTALGCVPTEMNKFIPWLLNALFGIAGGIAFLLMVYGFILVATSSGDEKKMAGAKETISSALIGLLVCIFSIFILRLIAINILQIPGL